MMMALLSMGTACSRFSWSPNVVLIAQPCVFGIIRFSSPFGAPVGFGGSFLIERLAILVFISSPDRCLALGGGRNGEVEFGGERGSVFGSHRGVGFEQQRATIF